MSDSKQYMTNESHTLEFNKHVVDSEAEVKKHALDAENRIALQHTPRQLMLARQGLWLGFAAVVWIATLVWDSHVHEVSARGFDTSWVLSVMAVSFACVSALSLFFRHRGQNRDEA